MFSQYFEGNNLGPHVSPLAQLGPDGSKFQLRDLGFSKLATRLPQNRMADPEMLDARPYQVFEKGSATAGAPDVLQKPVG